MLKGLLGASLMWLFLSIYKLITTTIKYMYWKRIGVPGTALIGTLKSATPKHKGRKTLSTDYIYDLTITWNNNKHTTLYTESTDKDKPSKYTPGQSFPILWIEKDERYIDIPATKNSIKEYLYAILLCLAALVGCFLIYQVIFE